MTRQPPPAPGLRPAKRKETPQKERQRMSPPLHTLTGRVGLAAAWLAALTLPPRCTP